MKTPEYNVDQLYKGNVTVYTEANPNPNSMKFMLNFMLIRDGGSYDFPDKESASESPLALAIYDNFSFVQRVFFMSNFITLTKDEATEWMDVIPKLKTFIKGYIEDENPVFNPKEAAVETSQEEDSEVIMKIKAVLEEYVKPAVESDGGAISFGEFQEESGQLKVLLQGSCSGCPSSTITLKNGIENLMTRMVPEVKEVVSEGI